MPAGDSFVLDGVGIDPNPIRGLVREDGLVVLQVGQQGDRRSTALTADDVRDVARLLLGLIDADQQSDADEQSSDDECEAKHHIPMPIYLDDEQRSRVEALAAARDVLTDNDRPLTTRHDQLDVARFILTGYASSSGERMA